MGILVDSSALFAWADQSSKEGEVLESFLAQNKEPLVTTNFLFAETISLITKRIGKFKGIEFGQSLRSSKIISLFDIQPKIQEEAWQLYRKYTDKDFDFIDATSFVFCGRKKIKKVMTLDHHFIQMKFQIVPDGIL